MSPARTIPVLPAEEGLRLDRWLKRRFPGVPHARLHKWLRTGQVRLDGKRAKAGDRLAAGQDVRLPPVDEEAPRPRKRRTPEGAEAAALRAMVLHRDARVLALNKPPGLAVQGGSGLSRHLDGLLDALRFDSADAPKLVHRLDKDTSGVLLLGRDAAATAKLAESFRTHAARKLYWALVVGAPKPSSGRVCLALAKAPGRRGERMAPGAKGARKAETIYRVVESAGQEAAWLALEPLTGRTHQLRAHCLALGVPILGDGKYGGRAAFLDLGQAGRKLHLHARAIRIPHPAGGVLEVTAPLPGHMMETWRLFGFDEGAARAGFAEDP